MAYRGQGSVICVSGKTDFPERKKVKKRKEATKNLGYHNDRRGERADGGRIVIISNYLFFFSFPPFLREGIWLRCAFGEWASAPSFFFPKKKSWVRPHSVGFRFLTNENGKKSIYLLWVVRGAVFAAHAPYSAKDAKRRSIVPYFFKASGWESPCCVEFSLEILKQYLPPRRRRRSDIHPQSLTDGQKKVQKWSMDLENIRTNK